MNEEEEKLVRAVIAGASEALKEKAKNPNGFDDEVMKAVTLKAKKIVKDID